MWFLKSLLVSLLLPPFGFVTMAICGLLIGQRRRLGRALIWVAVLGLVALAMPAVSESLMAALETGISTTPPASDPPQAIVILGAEAARVAGDPPGVRVGPLTLERLRTGAELARRTGLPVLVTGGSIQPDEPPVATLMAKSMAEDFQVPVRWTEPDSRDTWENASKSVILLRAAGIHSIYVVTHPWHMRRALQSFAPTGLVVTAAPTPIDWMGDLHLQDFLPRSSVWQTGYFALHEWVGRVWYQLR